MKKGSINPYVPTTFFLLVIVILFISALALKNYMIDQDEGQKNMLNQPEAPAMNTEMEQTDNSDPDNKIDSELLMSMQKAAEGQKFQVQIHLNQSDQLLIGSLQENEVRASVKKVTEPVLDEISQMDPTASAMDLSAIVVAELTAEQILQVTELQNIIRISANPTGHRAM